MTDKHTPGPWYAVRNSAFWEVNPAREYGDDHIPYTVADVCATAPDDPDGGLQEANARLIAAAPDLLEVAKMVDAWGNGLRHMTPHETATVRMARAAISKARGQA